MSFDNKKFDQIVTGVIDRQLYRQAPFIQVFRRCESTKTQALATEYISEILIRELFPGCEISEGENGRAALFQYEFSFTGFQEVLTWIKKSVNSGVYDNLDGKALSREQTIADMRQVAQALEIKELLKIMDEAMEKDTKDVSKTLLI